MMTLVSMARMRRAAYAVHMLHLDVHGGDVPSRAVVFHDFLAMVKRGDDGMFVALVLVVVRVSDDALVCSKVVLDHNPDVTHIHSKEP
ncbi:hypothetical protein [Bifidobacterium bombi]|uniref:hypothetical protein n=1 Tax=Bifidobacterium bombi TaxID=471511 RepID=UPI001F4D1490|nr:hypothetical protein [Bifidobacterium bombi]